MPCLTHYVNRVNSGQMREQFKNDVSSSVEHCEKLSANLRLKYYALIRVERNIQPINNVHRMDIKSVIFRAFVYTVYIHSRKTPLRTYHAIAYINQYQSGPIFFCTPLLLPNRDRYSTACLVVFTPKGVTDDRDVTKIDPKSKFAYFGTGLFFMMIFF